MERRNFIGILGGALASGIFVPKFGRWFHIYQPRNEYITIKNVNLRFLGREVYIAQWGDDSNPGTRLRPWRNFSRIRELPSGSTVNIGPGTWHETLWSGNGQEHMKIRGARFGRTVIAGAA